VSIPALAGEQGRFRDVDACPREADVDCVVVAPETDARPPTNWLASKQSPCAVPGVAMVKLSRDCCVSFTVPFGRGGRLSFPDSPYVAAPVTVMA
jgi:hypothetical protein